MEHGGRQMRTAIAASGPALTSSRDGVIEEFYRRRHIRYPLRVPVEFQMMSQGQQREAVKARSRDISEAGVFVLCKTLPVLGGNMELIMRLPVGQGGTAPLVLEMTGEVIRLETPSGRENQWGFAVCARRTIFRSPS
jgi:PilZ domain